MSYLGYKSLALFIWFFTVWWLLTLSETQEELSLSSECSSSSSGTAGLSVREGRWARFKAQHQWRLRLTDPLDSNHGELFNHPKRDFSWVFPCLLQKIGCITFFSYLTEFGLAFLRYYLYIFQHNRMLIEVYTPWFVSHRVKVYVHIFLCNSKTFQVIIIYYGHNTNWFWTLEI